MPENAGTRTLAAIVFTDVVGFSRMVGLNEERALELLARDFALMRRSCERHTGRVINVMGDGLMMLFPSAVEAMQCALEVQSELKRQAAISPPDDVLHHRMGVHVGDVVLDGDNVYGDGVNVASRLQAEARPDAICFSRTVYDVIKNKVPVEATYLGPRALRNIPERVMVWQALPPVDRRDAQASDLVIMSPPYTGASGAKGIVLLVLSVALLAFFVVGALVLGPRLGKGNPSPIVIHKKTKKVQPLPPDPSVHPETSGPPTGSDLSRQLDALRPRYDFMGMASLVAAAPPGSVPDAAGLYQRYLALADMGNWLDQQLASATPESPLRANVDLGGGEVPSAVYTGPGGLTVDTGSNPQLKSLSSLPPASVYNLLSAAAQSPQAPSMASQWIEMFAQEYKLAR